MSILNTAPLLVSARDFRATWRQRWADASSTTRTRVQVGVFLAVVAVAYHYSLETLIKTLNLNTPLAYIGLVPLIALCMAAVRSRPATEEPAIHDRQVDYILGVPFVLCALAINFLLPRQLSAMFWVWRIDLLSLPFFVAGVASIIFGVRAVWRQRLALAYLFLAWPLPYSLVLLGFLGRFTTITLKTLAPLASTLRVAAPVPGGDGSIFRVTHAGRAFPLSVVSACSGVNGMVGFLLVGAAFGAVVTGPRVRKALWLLFGLALLWAINLGRLLFIFWAGKRYGEHFAIQVLHPIIGLVTFNIGIIIMIVLLKPAGLRLGTRRGGNVAAAPATPEPSSMPRPLAVPRVYAAIALVVVAGAVLGVNNGGLRVYDLVANAAGEPKLTSYLDYPSSPPGWQKAVFAYEFTFARPFFGESSKWYRWSYLTDPNGQSDLNSSVPVVADVVNTSDLSSFSAYGVEACYRFHGYSLRDVAEVSLGGGITGQALSYSTTRHDDWTLVFWIWPIKNTPKTRYERVILYMQDTAAANVQSPGDVGGIRSLKGALTGSDTTQRVLIRNRTFLVDFAREVIKAQANVPVGSNLAHLNNAQIKHNAPAAGKPSTDVGPNQVPYRPETTPTIVPTSS
jgi:exosortase/archaeosortase family protein